MTNVIERIGNGKVKRFCIKSFDGQWFAPTNGKAYRNEERARADAKEMGIAIAAVGDVYEILAQMRSTSK